MAITILHLEGPLARQVDEFDDFIEVITFGRSPECEVVYPPECTIVAEKHFQLQRTKSGDFCVKLFGNSYVAINCIRAEDGMVVEPRSVISLGDRHGPSVRFIPPVWLTSLTEIGDALEAEEMVVAEENADASSLEEALSRRISQHCEMRSCPRSPLGAKDVDLLLTRRSQVAADVAGLPAEFVLGTLAPSAREFKQPLSILCEPYLQPHYFSHSVGSK